MLFIIEIPQFSHFCLSNLHIHVHVLQAIQEFKTKIQTFLISKPLTV